MQGNIAPLHFLGTGAVRYSRLLPRAEAASSAGLALQGWSISDAVGSRGGATDATNAADAADYKHVLMHGIREASHFPHRLEGDVTVTTA